MSAIDKSYYSLVLEVGNENFGRSYFIEKCIALIAYIQKPSIKSMPHITVRFFNNRAELAYYYLDKAEIDTLNIIKAGRFQSEDGKLFTVYLQCESDELEGLEYKKDFPFSRLHITLYDGPDEEYSQKLLDVLNRIDWNIRLKFDPHRRLCGKRIGKSSRSADFLNKIFKYWKEVLKNSSFANEFISDVVHLSKIDDLCKEDRLRLTKDVLNALDRYIKEYNDGIKITSKYSEKYKPSSAKLVDPYDIKSSDGFSKATLAAYITPPEFAKEMAATALNSLAFNEIHFGDSSVGTGALFLALYQAINRSNHVIGSAIGIDIDSNMANEVCYKYGSRGLDVIYEDALFVNYDSLPRRNLMIVNPPYVCHSDLPQEYIAKIGQIAKQSVGYTVSKSADAYVYHMLTLDKWLDDDGIGVWLLPSSFLYTQYAEVLRRYLTEKVTLLKIHKYDETITHFESRQINVSLIAFKKKMPLESELVDIQFDMKNGKKYINSTIGYLRDNKSNWLRALMNKLNETDVIKSDTNPTGYVFSDLFEIKRGIATGANNFFVLSLERAQELEIPEFAYKPILPKSRYLNDDIIESYDNGYPKLSNPKVVIDCDLPEEVIKQEYPKFYDYLKSAYESTKDKPIISRALVRARTPWYKQEYRAPAPFLLTYMGRPKSGGVSPLNFIRNKSNAIALNTYVLLYPRKWLQEILDKDSLLSDRLFDSLKASSGFLSSQSRIYSGELHKIEPGELKKIEVFNLPNSIIEVAKEHLKKSF